MTIKDEILSALNIVNFRLASLYEGSEEYQRDTTTRELETILEHLDEALTIIENREDAIREAAESLGEEK